jgi:penicillin-binding protein 2
VGRIPTTSTWETKYRNAGYELDDYVGVTGIEAAFEEELRGQKGREQVWKTGRGHVLGSQIIEPAVPGAQVSLTIDLRLQQLAESLLVGQKGVILAADPRNGEMLAWASSPGYDLNRPTRMDDPTSKPWVNRAIQEWYRPGSTFKIVTGLAALEAGWDPARRVECDHRFFLPNWKIPFTCLGWHDSVEMIRAYQVSCNIYFYTLADYLYTRDPQNAGYRLVQTAGRLGFGSPTGVLVQETSERGLGFAEKRGRLPTLENLRSERGSVLHTAIGQGRVDVTPLQMLMAYAALANGGEVLVPRLVQRVPGQTDGEAALPPKIVKTTVGLNPEHRRVIVEGLKAVVRPGGTGDSAGFQPQWAVAGKTSTAERGGDVEPDAWFIGFAPADRPEIVVLVLIEHGGHGGKVAAPLAAKIFGHYFNPARTPAVAGGGVEAGTRRPEVGGAKLVKMQE